MRTSVSHPLLNARVQPPNCAGEIGMTICPGNVDPYPLSGDGWDRQLDIDLNLIRDQKVTTLVTLLETHEFRLLKIQDLGTATKHRGMMWLHLAIVDGATPDNNFERPWLSAGKALHAELNDGALIALHCRGGLGRTGTIAARLLMENGVAIEEAIIQVREARPGAIENATQEHYLRQLPGQMIQSGT